MIIELLSVFGVSLLGFMFFGSIAGILYSANKAFLLRQGVSGADLHDRSMSLLVGEVVVICFALLAWYNVSSCSGGYHVSINSTRSVAHGACLI